MGKKKKQTRKTPSRKISKPKEPKEGIYMGIPYESFCELSCLFFAEELIKAGYVSKVTRCESYVLCNPIQNTYAIKLKRGSKQETQTVSHGVTYTPDYDIYFTSKALGIFCWDLNSNDKWEKNLLVAQAIPYTGLPSQYSPTPESKKLYRVCVEVKPDFQRNSTTPKSVQSMKWLMQKHGVFVNLFRPNRIFEGLFTPQKYLVTERGTPRLLKYKVLNLQQYLKKISLES